MPFGVYPLLSKWGFINLGEVTGGVSLLFAEALAGVISWSVPAWLFALNRTFMAAYFQKEAAPIKALFTGAGLVQLTQNMLEVLRWGLWMSPIINSFLRPMGEPTWYNQDGAIRTLVALFKDLTLSPEAFRAWSVQVFIYLLAYDGVRILIWLDHMGLRVATLVNLSFLGMDRLDERLARFLSPAATARCIPESVKRFTTWAPLLIPFFIPRGRDWDYAWSQSEDLQRQAPCGAGLRTADAAARGKGPCPARGGSGRHGIFHAGSVGARFARAHVSALLEPQQFRLRGDTQGERRSFQPDMRTELRRQQAFLRSFGSRRTNPLYRGHNGRRRGVGASWPRARQLSRRTSPCALMSGKPKTHCGLTIPVTTCTPASRSPCRMHDAAVELWTIRWKICCPGASRHFKAGSLPGVGAQSTRCRPRDTPSTTGYLPRWNTVDALQAVLAWDKHSKAMGLLAADEPPNGFLSSRMDFIGRARSLWMPRALETLAFAAAQDTEAHPTFDPIGSLLFEVTLAAQLIAGCVS